MESSEKPPLFHGMTKKEILDLYYQKGTILHFDTPQKPKPRTTARKVSNFGKNRLASLRFLERRNNSEPPIFDDLRWNKEGHVSIEKTQKWENSWVPVCSIIKHNELTLVKIIDFKFGIGNKPNTPVYTFEAGYGIFNTVEEAYTSYKNKK